MRKSSTGSNAARLNASLLAYCNQQGSFRDLGVQVLYKTHENSCIKQESQDHSTECGHCLGHVEITEGAV